MSPKEQGSPHSLGSINSEITKAFLSLEESAEPETYLTGQLKEAVALEALYKRELQELNIAGETSPKQCLTKNTKRSEPTLEDLLKAQQEISDSLSNSTSANPLTPSPEAKVQGYFELHQSYEKEPLETLINLASQGFSATEIALIQQTRLDWTQDPKNYLFFINIICDYFLKDIGYHITPINCAKAIFVNNLIENRQRSLESLNKTLLTGILYFKKRKAEVEAISKNTSYNTNLSPSNSGTISLSPSNSEQRIESSSMLTCTELCEKTGIDKKPLDFLIKVAAEYVSEELISPLHNLIEGWDNKENYLKTITLITKDRLPEKNEFILDAKSIFADSTSTEDKATKLDNLSKRIVIDLLYDIYTYLVLTTENFPASIQQELSHRSLDRCSGDDTFSETPPQAKETAQVIPESVKAEIKRMLFEKDTTKASRNIHSFMEPTAASQRKAKKKTTPPKQLKNKAWK